jgi:hypothetical protein
MSAKANEYDRLWYLVIPPVMTFLDDYQVSYKLKGVRLVTELLEHVPREILKRTGVDGLLLTASSFSFPLSKYLNGYLVSQHLSSPIGRSRISQTNKRHYICFSVGDFAHDNSGLCSAI